MPTPDPHPDVQVDQQALVLMDVTQEVWHAVHVCRAICHMEQSVFSVKLEQNPFCGLRYLFL